LANPDGPHAGDFSNLKVGADGTGSLDTIDSLVTLKEGRNSLFRPGGTSLITHADPDDEKTDPAGNSGARVAIIRSVTRMTRNRRPTDFCSTLCHR
jgi:Cu-Zn family superoxide dismutase